MTHELYGNGAHVAVFLTNDGKRLYVSNEFFATREEAEEKGRHVCRQGETIIGTLHVSANEMRRLFAGEFFEPQQR